MLEDLDATHGWHAQVQNGGIKALALQRLQRQTAIGELRDIVAHSGEFSAHDLAQAFFIIDKQDSQFTHTSPRLNFHAASRGPLNVWPGID